MTKIKIVGALIFMLFIILAFIFNRSLKENIAHNNIIDTINKQKNFTQEISKNIFYIYKDQNRTTDKLDLSIKEFIANMNDREEDLKNSEKVVKLWNLFYLYVQNFRDQIKNKSIYSNIILEKSIKDIYNMNLELMIEFDTIIITKQKEFNNRQNIYKVLQYFLFILLISLLLYIFTQLKTVISFVQKFLSTSKTIIKNSSIRELQPIEIDGAINDISEAKNNFNTLVGEINNSIIFANSSIEHSCKSVEIVEQHIEDLIELIYLMNGNARDKELRKKEDALIQSLEELSATTKKLQDLRVDLDSLISYSNQNRVKN